MLNLKHLAVSSALFLASTLVIFLSCRLVNWLLLHCYCTVTALLQQTERFPVIHFIHSFRPCQTPDFYFDSWNAFIWNALSSALSAAAVPLCLSLLQLSLRPPLLCLPLKDVQLCSSRSADVLQNPAGDEIKLLGFDGNPVLGWKPGSD